MNWLSRLRSGAARAAPLLGLLLLAGLLAPAAALAEGGLAISGSFYTQAFEIPQGATASGPSIYVVVFNNGSAPLKVRMTSQAPLGVNIMLSQKDITLPPGGQQQVLVGVEVTRDAAPGQYEISVTAESYKEGMSGIQLAGAAGQNAKLTVLGESAQVTVQAVSPEGAPVTATVRLSRVSGGQPHEVAYSETGKLEAKVAPGSFTAASYVGGEKLTEQSFTVAANDKKTVTLAAATVYFEGFGIVPNSQKDTGKLAFVQMVYTVRNLYQRVDKGEVILQVSRNGTALDPMSLASLSPLDLGSAGLNYNYIPAGGWSDGIWEFKLLLNLNGKPYAGSAVQRLGVSNGVAGAVGTSPASDGSESPAGAGTKMNYVLIGGIAAAVVLMIVLILRLRRR